MRKITLLMTAIVLTAGTSYGVMLNEGTQELGLEGAVQFQSPAGTDYTADVRLGHFVADLIQVGAVAGVSDNDLATRWNVGAFGEYNVDLGMDLVPFMGVSGAYNYVDPDVGSSDDAFVLGGYAGGKHFLAHNVAVSLKYLFEWATDDVFLDNGDVEDTNHSIRLGMRYFF